MLQLHHVAAHPENEGRSGVARKRIPFPPNLLKSRGVSGKTSGPQSTEKSHCCYSSLTPARPQYHWCCRCLLSSHSQHTAHCTPTCRLAALSPHRAHPYAACVSLAHIHRTIARHVVAPGRRRGRRLRCRSVGGDGPHRGRQPRVEPQHQLLPLVRQPDLLRRRPHL